MSSTLDESHWHHLLAAEGLDGSTWSERPDTRFAAHRHAYDKVLVVISGSIVLTLEGAGLDVTLAPGDRLELPAETAHSALVGPHGVVCLEADPERGRLSREPRHRPGWAREISPEVTGPQR